MYSNKTWINEKFAPELLESKSDLVDCMLDQIKEMVSELSYIFLFYFMYLTNCLIATNAINVQN